jgi:ABC-type uncharacterized transport system ATPase subunit
MCGVTKNTLVDQIRGHVRVWIGRLTYSAMIYKKRIELNKMPEHNVIRENQLEGTS